MTYGLCECSDNIHYFLPFVVENTGSETAGTQRWRDWKNTKALESNTTPTQLQQTANELPTPVQQTANVDKEIEKREKSKSIRTFVPPTLEEVKAYATENNLNVDAERFYRYFTTPNDKGETWVDSKGNKVRNWKQKMLTWEKMNSQSSKTDRARMNNTLLNYNEKGRSHASVQEIELDLEEL